MKLIIDIPEEYLKTIKAIPDETSSLDMLLIKYGTPFDSVIEDIKEVSYDLCGRTVCNYIDILEIIGKHIGKENK